jgi:c-di-GMP-binding flagellar brake protein YcgR
MQLEKRQHERHRTAGKITLSAAGRVLTGELFDVSKTGMALVLEEAPDFEISPDIQWLCHVDSNDFPTTVSFPARIVRQQKLENGVLLGCELCL